MLSIYPYLEVWQHSAFDCQTMELKETLPCLHRWSWGGAGHQHLEVPGNQHPRTYYHTSPPWWRKFRDWCVSLGNLRGRNSAATFLKLWDSRTISPHSDLQIIIIIIFFTFMFQGNPSGNCCWNVQCRPKWTTDWTTASPLEPHVSQSDSESHRKASSDNVITSQFFCHL